MKTITKIIKILKVLVYVLLGLIGGLILLSILNIPGGIKLLIVQSGSMEPNIKLGSIVIIKPEEKYSINDIVTIKESSDNTVTFTHRIIEEKMTDNVLSFITKGDANDTPDPGLKSPENIVGKVIFAIPYLGYPINYSKTREGLLIMVVIPATIIIYSEILNIQKETKKIILAEKGTKNEKPLT